jgi:hypothetical protein
MPANINNFNKFELRFAIYFYSFIKILWL